MLAAGPVAGASSRSPIAFRGCPVDGPNRYVDDFGDARFGGGFHQHEGIDIFAPSGTPIRAPFAGTVKVSSNWAGGLAVYVYGKAGFVYNAHLSRLGRTGKVAPGAIIGYVGNSGDALGGATHDHFEWHPGEGQAVDAFALLNSACRAGGAGSGWAQKGRADASAPLQKLA